MMATEKLEFSLRLRHHTSDLEKVTQDLGMVPRVGWDKGDQNRTIREDPLSGTRDLSYRSFPIETVLDTDLSDALPACLRKLAPLASVLQTFVASGGEAALAVGWFCDSAVGGGRVALEAVKEMDRLRLSLDLYLYIGDQSATDDL
jgi:hypothetical protein